MNITRRACELATLGILGVLCVISILNVRRWFMDDIDGPVLGQLHCLSPVHGGVSPLAPPWLFDDSGRIRSGYINDANVFLLALVPFSGSSFLLLGFGPEKANNDALFKKMVPRRWREKLERDATFFFDDDDAELRVLQPTKSLLLPLFMGCREQPQCKSKVLRMNDDSKYLKSLSVQVCSFPHRGPKLPPTLWRPMPPTRTVHITDSMTVPVNEGKHNSRELRTATLYHSRRRRNHSQRKRGFSIVAAVNSFTPHAMELIQHALNIKVTHFYLGVCSPEGSPAWNQYTRSLERFIESGTATVFSVGDFGDATGTERKVFNRITACRMPVYQIALYDAKRYNDQFIFTQDFNELLVPMPTVQEGNVILPMAMQRVANNLKKSLANTCYIQVHADEVPTRRFEGGKQPYVSSTLLSERFPDRCDCGPLMPLHKRSYSNVNNTCGNAYSKTIANVDLVSILGIHNHVACTTQEDEDGLSILADPAVLRVHHFVDMWKDRHLPTCRGQQGEFTLLPAEYVSILSDHGGEHST